MIKLKESDLENIQKAIEIEIKHQYIDLQGKKSSFSKYISSLARTFYNIPPKDKRWGDIVLLFDRYSLMTTSDRIQAIHTLQSLMCAPVTQKILKELKNLESQSEKTQENSEKDKKDFNETPETIDVQYVKGVGPILANKLNSLHIFTAYDLLVNYPRDHIDFKTQAKISELEPGQDVTIFGVIRKVNAYNSRRNPKLAIVTIQVYDGSGTISISWFYSSKNRYLLEKYKDQYQKGSQVLVSGRVKFDNYSKKNTIDKPVLEIVYNSEEEFESLHTARIVPIYRLTEGLSVKLLRRAIYNAIEKYLPLVKETLPDEIIKKYDLVDKQTAIKQIHFPENFEEIQKAKKRIIFEEFFLYQLHLATIRKEFKQNKSALSFDHKPDGLIDSFIKNLPFDLTASQKKVYAEILTDLKSEEPMYRLLQGDVGSGKTVVAALALLSAIENGYQSAIMAPTEVLAEQHYKQFVEWLTPLGIRIGLFLGRLTIKQRREMKQNLESGLTNLAIGTHALIQEDIVFNNLGLIVIDEQHRFGVMQRTKLKSKGENPELLTMTATPIPRTLALTLHGDLDVSTIDELPPGRKPVITKLSRSGERVKAYRLIEEEINKGRQAYIVFPLIEESEKLSAKAATEEAAKLKKTIFKKYSIGLIHGKLQNNVKDQVMEDFRNGKYDILVATTVIEVGVDVPNATIMMIENADRFGLAQLHQLRGRVGRSSHQSYCLLISNVLSEETRNRLSILEQTNNGFIIADYDLKIRGPGEFLGTRQSGVPEFSMASLTDNPDILQLARDAAFELVNAEDDKKFKEILKNFTINYSDTFELVGSG